MFLSVFGVVVVVVVVDCCCCVVAGHWWPQPLVGQIAQENFIDSTLFHSVLLWPSVKGGILTTCRGHRVNPSGRYC